MIAMSTTSDIRERLTSLQASHRMESDVTCSSANLAAVAELSEGNPLEAMGPPGLLEIVESILKDRPRLERIIGDPSLSAELIPRFLAVSLIGFTLFGVALAILVEAIGLRVELAPVREALEGTRALILFEPAAGRDPIGISLRGLKLIGAYDVGLVAAAGVCLPSLYFYALLAGVPLSMVRVAVHTLKGMATTSVALVGILPIYMALGLGVAVFGLPRMVGESAVWLGLALPFLAGLSGMMSLYAGFTALAEGIPAERRCARACLLRRLIVSWSVCYAAVTPVMIYTLWEYFARNSVS